MVKYSVVTLTAAIATVSAARSPPFTLGKRNLRRGDPATEALLKKAIPYRKGGKSRHLQEQNNEIDGSYNLKFSQCVDIKTLDENLFGNDMISYAQAGQVVSSRSFVLFHVCQGSNCYYESEDDLYIVDLATYMKNVAVFHASKRRNYCNACNQFADSCNADVDGYDMEAEQAYGAAEDGDDEDEIEQEEVEEENADSEDLASDSVDGEVEEDEDEGDVANSEDEVSEDEGMEDNESSQDEQEEAAEANANAYGAAQGQDDAEVEDGNEEDSDDKDEDSVDDEEEVEAEPEEDVESEDGDEDEIVVEDSVDGTDDEEEEAVEADANAYGAAQEQDGSDEERDGVDAEEPEENDVDSKDDEEEENEVEDEMEDEVEDEVDVEDSVDESGDVEDEDEERKLQTKAQRRVKSLIDCEVCVAYNCFDEEDEDVDDGSMNQDELDGNIADWIANLAQCQQSGVQLNGMNLYVGAMCSPYGDGVELAVFMDDECTMYTNQMAFSSAYDPYNGQEANGDDGLNYAAFAEIYIKNAFTEVMPCLNEEYADPNEAENQDAEEEERYEINDYCKQILNNGAIEYATCDADQNEADEQAVDENSDENENSWYTYQMTAENAQNLEQACVTVKKLDGEIGNLYDEAHSGTWYARNKRGQIISSKSEQKTGMGAGAISSIILGCVAVFGGAAYALMNKKQATVHSKYQGGTMS